MGINCSYCKHPKTIAFTQVTMITYFRRLRFGAYKGAITFIYGKLRVGKRFPVPACIGMKPQSNKIYASS